MIGLLIAAVIAAIVYWILVAVGLPVLIAAICALLVFLVGIGGGGVYPGGSRWR